MALGGSRRLGEIEVGGSKRNRMLAVQRRDWNGGRMRGTRGRYVVLCSDRKSVRKRRWGPGGEGFAWAIEEMGGEEELVGRRVRVGVGMGLGVGVDVGVDNRIAIVLRL